jgi:hypothetical protein
MLINSLENVRRRVRLLGVLYGVGVVLAAAVALLLVVILLDYVLHFAAIPRLLILLACVGGVGYGLYRLVITPWLAKLSINDVAGRLEQAFPQFNDRLRSTVDFLRTDIPGSDVMKQRVVGEAVEMAGRLDLSSAVVARPAWYAIGGGAAAVLLLILLGVLAPRFSAIAFSRFFTPFSGQEWPKRVQIELAGDLPTRVPVGQRVEVQMKLARGDSPSRKARIIYQYDNGPRQEEYMNRGKDGTYTASLDARVESGKPAADLKIWMQAGDDEMQLVPITVVPRLSIKSVEAQVAPPPYVTNQAPTTVNLTAAPALAADGSRIAISIGFSKPLAPQTKVELIPASQEMLAPTDLQWTAATGTSATASFTARNSLRFHIRATDVDGFSNNALEEYELVVRPDQNPSVQIENPRRNEERTVKSMVPLVGLVEDDYGIQGLKLVIERATDQKRWEIELMKDNAAVAPAVASRAEGTPDRLRMRVNYQWELAALADANLKAGDVLEYYLLAKDNFNLDGQTHPEVPSGRLRINIITEEELAARVIDELRQIKNQIQGVKTAVDRTRQETMGLAEDTKDRKELDPADKAALERLTNQQATSTAQTKQIASRVEDLRNRMAENRAEQSQELNDLARNVAADLERAAENPMRQATNELSSVNRNNSTTQPSGAQNQPTQQERADALAKASESQNEASQELQRALDRMNNIGSLQETMARLRNLLEEQRRISRDTREVGRDNLGKTPEQMKPEDRDKLNRAADEQGKLAEQTNRAMEDMQRQGQQMQRSDPSSAEAMKRAAQTGRQQQTTQNQQNASRQARQNQQAQAQAAQKQAELGLELMLDDLREAERHKLAELQKKLAELQEQVKNLIRRQAGHNLDNVNVQGAEKVAQVGNETIKDLLDKAERDPEHLPQVPQVAQLNGPQEQTERNTRDISKSAEEMPNGAEAASRLTRAAARMERAAVNLRDKKLPEAYDPSQVEALGELVAASRDIQKQQEEAAQQAQEQEKEAIRQRYAKVRDEQKKLNDDTTRIDGARDPNGALGRVDLVRLGQMPGEQGKLADTVNGINEDLRSLGSTVYIWAGKDIVDSMNDVKQDLGKQVTGVPTRSEQKRIVDQLDAMIRNLAIKPRESKFAQDQQGGGGGGGQQRQRLPSEAELRLLQDLQNAINTSTKTIDAQPEKDKAKLLALGTRQGEMRSVLDKMLQEASQGQVKLGPEPDNRDQLPEEANVEDVDKQELQQDLLGGAPKEDNTEREASLIGDRMARSRQRLALNNDPGKVTQEIQRRIIVDLDSLIQQAQQQQAQTRNQRQQQQQGQQMQQARGQQGQPQNQGQPGQQQQQGRQAAADSRAPGQAAVREDLSKEIADSREDWGAVAPRLRDAVMEGAGEQPPEDYRRFIEDYYRSVGNEAAGQ